MCLLVNKYNKEKVADKDIPCYKVVRYDIQFSRYITPFTRTPFKINKGYEFSSYRLLPCEIKALYINHPLSDHIEVEGGFIHTFQNPLSALRYINMCAMGPAAIVKCVIPKDTNYFEGVDYVTDHSAYASGKIVVEKKIYDNYHENVPEYMAVLD